MPFSSIYTALKTENLQHALLHFMPLVSFNTPLKRQETFGFLKFSGGIERSQWHEMG